ncbi:MAG: bifunctional UDP-N-acetylglucosamine diphosphorylase/glucosamine-1-phosphate N-acetyltransferase GlmU, partial [Chromatiales bacterium]|nr:bifunctional UDP-N-acetylglucosamine diphosphorylase/glucosamine-1-phosphate N-acetyltransferase GlmU [Chromatiales bacterium]
DILRETVALAGQDSLVVVTAKVLDPTGYGRILRTEQGEMVAIREQKDATPGELEIDEINSGIMAAPCVRWRTWLKNITADNLQGELYLTDAIPAALTDKVRVSTVMSHNEDEISGINDRRQLARLERAYQRLQADELMLAGTTLADPERIDVRGTLTVGQDVYIDVNAVFEGSVTLGDGTRIGPNCWLNECTLADGVEVLANSMIDQSSVGSGARIGPFARLRPQSVVGDNVHVGNFVEIKKSNLADGAKVNHLTYVGDTDVGARVNVGAGTITCNYDGVNKHRTVIEADAFIGSGTMLVAPVVVGAGATIGAGSTISRDAPANALTFNRAKSRTVDGWLRPTKKLS